MGFHFRWICRNFVCVLLLNHPTSNSVTGSTIRTWLPGKIDPKDWQVLLGFQPYFFRDICQVIMVYLPTWMVDFYDKCRANIQSSHGSYGFESSNQRCKVPLDTYFGQYTHLVVYTRSNLLRTNHTCRRDSRVRGVKGLEVMKNIPISSMYGIFTYIYLRLPYSSRWWQLKYVLFSSLFGEEPILTSIFLEGVETTN